MGDQRKYTWKEILGFAICLYLAVGLYQSIYPTWNKSKSIFDYHVSSFPPPRGIHVRIKNESDLWKLFDKRVFGSFTPPAKMVYFLSTVDEHPAYYNMQECISLYGHPLDSDNDFHYYVTSLSRIGVSKKEYCLKAFLSNFTVDSYILDNELKQLVSQDKNLTRIWVEVKDSKQDPPLFCIVNYPFIESVYWSRTISAVKLETY